MDESPRAIVREIDGQLVLDDPDVVAVVRAVQKHNCTLTLAANGDRIAHFAKRMADLGKSQADVVIVVLNVDDIHGGPLAESLMPGFNWQEIRDRGEVPFARGLAERQGIQGVLDMIDAEAGKKLRDTTGIAVVVVDHGVAEVFNA